MQESRDFKFPYDARDAAAARERLPIGPSERTRSGKLRNGMAYYVAESQKPREHAALALAVDAGSVFEGEGERGRGRWRTKANGGGGRVEQAALALRAASLALCAERSTHPQLCPSCMATVFFTGFRAVTCATLNGAFFVGYQAEVRQPG